MPGRSAAGARSSRKRNTEPATRSKSESRPGKYPARREGVAISNVEASASQVSWAKLVYWHQPSVGLLSQGTPQLPMLLQPDSSALRTVCFQSQFAQPASANNSANGRRYLMRPSGPEAKAPPA